MKQAILLALLLCLCPALARAQTKLRDFYRIEPHHLVAKNNRIFYLKKTKLPAEAATDSVVITTRSVTTTTSQPGAARQPVVTVTTERRKTVTTSQDGKTRYDTVQARIRNPRGVTFRVRQEKDTLYLTPLPFSNDGFAAPDPERRLDANGVAHSVNSKNAGTYFIKLSKAPNKAGAFTKLHSITWNVGVLTVPARIYFGSGGSRSQVSILSGAAAYVSRAIGNRRFFSDGTSNFTSAEPLFFLGTTLLSPNSDAPATVTATVPALSFGFGFLAGNGDLKTGLVAGYDIAVTSAGNTSDYNHPIFMGIVLSLALTPFKLGNN